MLRRLPVSRRVMSPACLPQFLRSEARCCDAGSGVVFPLVSLCLQMLDAVRPAGGRVSHLSPCVSQSRLPVSAVGCQMLTLAPGFSACVSDVSRRLSLVSQSLRSDAMLRRWLPDAATLAAGSCLPLVSLCLSCFLLVSLLPDAVTPAPGSCLPLVPLSPSLVSLRLRPDARCCDAGSGACLPVSCSLCDAVTRLRVRVSRLSPCVSQLLRSEARCCDAGSGVVSPACLPVSPSLYGQLPDALTPVPLVSLCLPVSSVFAVGC